MAEIEQDEGGQTRDAARFLQTTVIQRQPLETFLEAATNCPSAELGELFRSDLNARWRGGHRVPAEEYICRLKGHAANQETKVDLIYTEYLIREELQLSVDPEDFYRRFPEQAAELRDQFALHSAVREAGPSLDGAVTTDGEAQPEAPASASEIFPRPFGRYRLVQLLGRGGMGKVYLAHDPLLDRKVAIKIPRRIEGNPALIARFLREAQAAAALHHPQLCSIYDVGQVEGIDYLTMPYIAAGTLSERVKGRQPMPPEAAVAIIVKCAEGLDAAHRAGVIHRDLKPANILVNEAGEPVITDFGLAVRTESRDPSLTAEGGMLGTVAYMPPEQIGYNAAAVGPRSDIYSLGVIFYELLTGRPPFMGAEQDILKRTLTETPVAPSRLNRALGNRFDHVCLKALAKAPEDRYQSMSEFANAITAAASGKVRPRTQIKPPGFSSLIIFSILAACAVWLVFGGSIWNHVSLATHKDPLRVGAVWSGTYHFVPPFESEGVVSLTITGRTGDNFEGIYATMSPYRWKVKGTTSEGTIQWELTAPLTTEAAGAVAPQRAFISGSYTQDQITATYRDQGDDSRANLVLTRQK